MSAENIAVFRQHYNHLLDHPKQARQNLPETLDTITQTFTALASLGSDEVKSLNVEGREIPVNQLKGEDVRLFAQFAKKILAKAAIPEHEARQMRENIAALQEHGLEELTWAPPSPPPPARKLNPIDRFRNILVAQKPVLHMPFGLEDRKRAGNASLKTALDNIDQEISLHTRFEPLDEGDGITARAVNLISQDLKALQDHAFEVKKVERVRNIRSIVVKAVVTAAIVGSLFAVGFVLTFMFPPLGLLFMGAAVIGAFLFGTRGVGSLILNRLNLKQKPQFVASLQPLRTFDNYKKLAQEPAFEAFAAVPENRFDKLQGNKQDLYKLLDIYALQKTYDSDLTKARDALLAAEGKPAAKALALAQFQKVNEELVHLNALREGLHLNPLPPPDF